MSAPNPPTMGLDKALFNMSDDQKNMLIKAMRQHIIKLEGYCKFDRESKCKCGQIIKTLDFLKCDRCARLMCAKCAKQNCSDCKIYLCSSECFAKGKKGKYGERCGQCQDNWRLQMHNREATVYNCGECADNSDGKLSVCDICGEERCRFHAKYCDKGRRIVCYVCDLKLKCSCGKTHMVDYD